GNVGDSYTNTVTATGHDDEGDPASASASATVTYTDVTPSISISKTANPTSVSEGGVGSQSVTYTYTITNTSSAGTDPVTLTSVVDDKVGSLLADAIAANGGSAVLAPGVSVTFTETQTVTAGNVGDSYTNTVTA